MVTIKDIAREAGVSVGTVSNVLNRPSYVTSAVRERVHAAMNRLDYFPATHARQYRPGRQRVLAMSIADLANPYFADICVGAEKEANRMGVGIIVSNASEDAEREAQNLTLLEQQRVHGIIVASVDDANPHLLELSLRGLPIVHIDRVNPNMKGCSLSIDNFEGGRLAAMHLIDEGHKRLGLLGSLSIGPQVVDRFAGFNDVVAQRGVALPVQLEAEIWTVAEGLAAALRFQELDPETRPRAIFCANDLLALGMMQGLLRAGLSVPDDVALIGFDDLNWAPLATVPLSSIRQPRDLMGAMAVTMLLSEIENSADHVHEAKIIPPELVVRRSSQKKS